MSWPAAELCGDALAGNSIPRFAPACKPQKSAHTGVLPVHGWIVRPDSDVSRITGVLRHVAALDRRGRARRGALVIIAESVAGLIRARGRVRRILQHLHQRTQILIQHLSLCFCIYSASELQYRTKQAGYSPQHGVNLQASAFCLQAEKTVHPSQSLPKSVRLLKMPFPAPICTPSAIANTVVG